MFTTAKGKATGKKIKKTGGGTAPHIDSIDEAVIRAYNGTVTVTGIQGIEETGIYNMIGYILGFLIISNLNSFHRHKY